MLFEREVFEERIRSPRLQRFAVSQVGLGILQYMYFLSN